MCRIFFQKRNEEKAHDAISRESEFISKPGCCWKKCDEGQQVPIFCIYNVSDHPGIDWTSSWEILPTSGPAQFSFSTWGYLWPGAFHSWCLLVRKDTRYPGSWSLSYNFVHGMFFPLDLLYLVGSSYSKNAHVSKSSKCCDLSCYCFWTEPVCV